MEAKAAVFVNSIFKNAAGEIVVEASNGSPEGPPFIRFVLPASEANTCYIGKRYYVLVSEEEVTD